MLNFINRQSRLVKALLAGWCFAILLGAFFSNTYIATQGAIKRISAEREGLSDVSVLFGVLHDLAKLQQLLASGSQTEGFIDKTQSLINSIQGRLDSAPYFQSERPKDQGLPLRIIWTDHLKIISKDPGVRHLQRVREMVETMRSAIVSVANHSGLILDPDLDTYYLMDAVVISLPEVISLLSEAGIIIQKSVIEDRPLSGEEFFSLSLFSKMLEKEIAQRLIKSVGVYSDEARKSGGAGDNLASAAHIAAHDHAVKVDRLIKITSVRAGNIYNQEIVDAYDEIMDATLDIQGQMAREFDAVLYKKILLHKKRMQLGALRSFIITGFLLLFIVILLRSQADASRIADQSVLIDEALDIGGIAVWEKNLLTGRFWVSLQFKKMIGYEGDDLADQEMIFESILSPDDLAHLKECGVRARAGEDLFSENVWHIKHRDGSTIKTNSRIICRKPAGQKLGRIVGIVSAGPLPQGPQG